MAPRTKTPRFESEAALCEAYVTAISTGHYKQGKGWTIYPETSGWDLLLVRGDGVQIGIEAKLALNPLVVSQALPEYRCDAYHGPDYRAVLVPSGDTGGMGRICAHIGITVITCPVPKTGYIQHPDPMLPGDDSWSGDSWHNWCPVKRSHVPEYVPDVAAGVPSPMKLTTWKIAAIKLSILLDDRPVTRADMKALGLNQQRWVDKTTGWLVATPDGYVRGPYCPDFRREHPKNYEEIKADRAKWEPVVAEFFKPAKAAAPKPGAVA